MPLPVLNDIILVLNDIISVSMEVNMYFESFRKAFTLERRGDGGKFYT